jgi:hypothetical protein
MEAVAMAGGQARRFYNLTLGRHSPLTAFTVFW